MYNIDDHHNVLESKRSSKHTLYNQYLEFNALWPVLFENVGISSFRLARPYFSCNINASIAMIRYGVLQVALVNQKVKCDTAKKYLSLLRIYLFDIPTYT